MFSAIFRTSRTDERRSSAPVTTCSTGRTLTPVTKIKKSYQLKDEYTQKWFDHYEVPGIEGGAIVVEVPRQERGVHTVQRLMLERGALASAVGDEAHLAAAIKSDAPIVHRPAHTGWYDDTRMFITPLHVAGDLKGKRVLSPNCKMLNGDDQLKVCGTLSDWKLIASAAKYSTTMIVALRAAFAAALLGLLNRPNFALMLYGPSKVGKSSAQLLAASVLGFGREKDLPSMNATKAGLLATAMDFHDCVLPLNEVATSDGAKHEIYVPLRNYTYQLMDGKDVMRHPSWQGVAAGAPATFRVICLLSSEKSPDEWAERNGEARDPGESARLIGVPVLMGKAASVFDRRRSKHDDKQRIAWESKQFTRLHELLPLNRGVAMQAYLDWLLADVGAHRERAKKLAERFERRVATPEHDPVTRDIIAKFAILLAGGLLAAEARILPFEAKTVRVAIRRACRAALMDLPDANAQLKADRDKLRERLAGAGILNADNCPKNK